MPPTLELSIWLDFLETEYLDTFIASGGSAIKFAVAPDEETRTALSADFARRARTRGYLAINVDASRTRIHMIDQLLFAIAEQVPWRETVDSVVKDIAHRAGFKLPHPGPDPFFLRLATANELDQDFIRLELRRGIEFGVFKNRRLMKDFRVAMTHLAQAHAVGGAEAETIFEVITDWLTGRNRSVSPVKPYSIFSRINRANARYLTESLSVWLGLGGYQGLAIVLDISRMSVPRNPRDDLVFYTKAALLDAYEVLRQFIDGLDELERSLIVVAPDPLFLDEDAMGRGIGAYQALKFRVYDEVRDARQANPLASLIRVTPDRSDNRR